MPSDESSERSYRGWSQRACEKALRRAADEIGHSPTINEYNDLDLGLAPTRKPILEHFDSWDEALGSAGLSPPDRNEYDSKDCLEAIRETADRLGHEPNTRDYVRLATGDPDLPCQRTIRFRFGTLSNAIEKAMEGYDD